MTAATPILQHRALADRDAEEVALLRRQFARCQPVAIRCQSGGGCCRREPVERTLQQLIGDRQEPRERRP